ncbi:FecR/PupR family sigma factor regulator [Bordetella tumulicola]|uniref:FecR/PupR family sigma factor regulator n=1 Tax=Bordetella tumulicola TaxID=1649133 RepID=UPI0039EE22B4
MTSQSSATSPKPCNAAALNLSSLSWCRTTPQVANVTPEVAEQAILWLLAQHEERVSPHVIGQWCQWRAQHPDHGRAWRRIEAVKGNQ